MKITFVGHSHINCIHRAYRQLGNKFNHLVEFVQLLDPQFLKPGRDNKGQLFDSLNQIMVKQAVAEASQGADLVVLCPRGNQHSVASIVNTGDSQEQINKIIKGLMANHSRWITALGSYVCSPAVVIPPPPPVESELNILKVPGSFSEKFAVYGVAPAHVRLQAWLYQKKLIKEAAEKSGLRFLELPSDVLSEEGFLREQYLAEDPTHGNAAYGKLILRYIADLLEKSAFTWITASETAYNSHKVADSQLNIKLIIGQHPYIGRPDYTFWKQAIAQVPMHQYDPVQDVPFKISHSDKVATAGSCFAQHISKRIRSGGFHFLVTEAPDNNELDNTDARGFYDFSARYGNIYTARQLVQLFDRAYGYFTPLDSYWQYAEDRFCDPFRPRIEPDGFPTIHELLDDRQRHFAAVRDLFSQLDFFVFTLGLTECWVSRLDGSAYPVAPGVVGGQFDPARYEFLNFGVDEVASDLKLFVHKLRTVNPKARLILTVSPVPLAATYEPRNVLVSTTYSKSVLRVAAEMITHACEGVYYFPSYEIIIGNYNRGRYFGSDLRSITQEGVDHVMSVFMRHLTEDSNIGSIIEEPSSETTEQDEHLLQMMKLAEAACDEELLEKK
jgi:GSCFA family